MENMTKNEKRYLSKRECGWCGQTLDRDGCGGIYGPACSSDELKKRRDDCLKNYKPRNIKQTQTKAG